MPGTAFRQVGREIQMQGVDANRRLETANGNPLTMQITVQSAQFRLVGTLHNDLLSPSPFTVVDGTPLPHAQSFRLLRTCKWDQSTGSDLVHDTLHPYFEVPGGADRNVHDGL